MKKGEQLYWNLVALLQETGWTLLYSTKTRSYTTYYIYPHDDAIPERSMIDELRKNFGRGSYIYKVEDIFNIWGMPYGDTMLSISLEN